MKGPVTKTLRKQQQQQQNKGKNKCIPANWLAEASADMLVG